MEWTHVWSFWFVLEFIGLSVVYSVEGSNLVDVETNVLEELYMYEVVISLSLVKAISYNVAWQDKCICLITYGLNMYVVCQRAEAWLWKMFWLCILDIMEYPLLMSIKRAGALHTDQPLLGNLYIILVKFRRSVWGSFLFLHNSIEFEPVGGKDVKVFLQPITAPFSSYVHRYLQLGRLLEWVAFLNNLRLSVP